MKPENVNPENVNRRDFHKLTVAAMGGLMAGSMIGCAGKTEKTPADAKTGTDANAQTDAGQEENPALAAWTGEHVCRGLNACKGQGKGGKNECAGLGECATVEAHTCSGQNTCKNLGGCGEAVASNECKGKGGCQVPLMKDIWADAYKKFKADMEKAGKADKLPAPKGSPSEN